MTNIRLHGWRTAAVGAATGALLLGSPMPPVSAAVKAPNATAARTTYGGETSQGMPIVVTMTRTHRQVTKVLAAVDLECGSGSAFTVPDGYTKLAVTRTGKFHTSFGPMTQRNDDGTTTDYQGHMSGALNRAKTKISGTWRISATDHDATGAVTDTCDSGPLTWHAAH